MKRLYTEDDVQRALEAVIGGKLRNLIKGFPRFRNKDLWIGF
jgi:hypothetical protein